MSPLHSLEEDVAKAVERQGPFAEGTLPPSALASIAAALGCDWATYWHVDAERRVLRPLVRWKAERVEAPALEHDTFGRTLTMSEGNAGHVWRTRKPIWTQDLVRDMCLPRSLDARAVGLQGGVWFAIKTNTTLYGVVEILGQSLPAANDEALLAIERLGMRLGELAARGGR